MRNRNLAAVAAIAALAACGKPTPGHGDNAAAANNAAASTAASNGIAPTNGGAAANATASAAPAAGVTLNPGEWETVVETAVTGLPPNLPPEAAARMKGQRMASRHCLSPERAAHPGGDFFSGKPVKGCVNNIRMVGGRVQGEMTCKDPRGETSTFAMDGSYGGDAFEAVMKATMTRGGQAMTMTSHSVGRRVAAACSAAAKDD
jgi:hypothetical protein